MSDEIRGLIGVLQRAERSQEVIATPSIQAQSSDRLARQLVRRSSFRTSGSASRSRASDRPPLIPIRDSDDEDAPGERLSHVSLSLGSEDEIVAATRKRRRSSKAALPGPSCSRRESTVQGLVSEGDGPLFAAQDDLISLAGRMRSAGCRLPSLASPTEKEAYAKVAVASSKVVEAFNEYVVAMEDRVEVSRNDKEIESIGSEIKRLSAEFEATKREGERDAWKIEAVTDDWKMTSQGSATLAAQIWLQEVVANIDLINELKDGGLTVDAELARLKDMEKHYEDLVTLAAVPDWSISELDLPQVSEDSVDQARGSFLFPLVEKTWHREGRPFANPKGYEIERAALVRNAFDPEMWAKRSQSPPGLKGRDRPPKKAKTNGVDHRLDVSGDTVVAKPFHWQFSHSKDCPITEDPDSVAHLVRHFKPAGCPLPSLRNMTEREAYVKMAVAHAKAMEANNDFAATLERRLQDVPRSDEIYEIKKVVWELKLGLKMAQDREGANAAQLAAAEKLGNQAASLEVCLRVVSNERKSALEHVFFLEAKVESSANKFSDDGATYDAKKALADSYLDVLVSLKEKWEKKKVAADCEARLREVMANIDLLKEIMNNNLLASDELLCLRTKEVELGSELDVMAVSDLSVGKLDLPQIAENLPEDFFAKVPSAVGDEMKRAGGQFEDGEFDIKE
ncbi:hypothetical protein F2Q70_00026428 [Brassica cretica]|uniref:Uncharacterized protein n=1 Tax=Brassica cretica TaxID=69181 RepID=A0A8S9I9J3_BRACR|nr:hypothetical protein F2Q68_00025984 [Brassica cretica]KAF2602725.1 hypothetical protein F2Q70_00026428 [Brassica cretica]